MNTGSNLRTLVVEHNGPVANVWLNRPERRNAMNQEMLEELTQVFRQLETTYETRVIVLGGKGPTFCAGADRKDSPGLDRIMNGTGVSAREKNWLAELGPRALSAIEDCNAITIARLQGHAVGGGLLLAVACDFRIAAEGTQFWFPEVELGTPLDWRGVPRLMSEIGVSHAREMVLASARVDAHRAESMGLVNQAVPMEQLDSTVTTLVSRFLERQELALLLTKKQFRAYAARALMGDASQFDADLLISSLGSDTAKQSFGVHQNEAKGDAKAPDRKQRLAER